jgi:DNA polymerase-3 subunit epsilon
MSYLVLDTEATDKYPETAEVLSVSIIDNTGVVLLDTLVRPVRHTVWPAAQKIHGITPAQVLRPDLPTLEELNPVIADILRGRVVVIYSAVYDTTILREAFALGPPAEVHCAMLKYAQDEQVAWWDNYHGNWHWHSLVSAAAHVGHQWQGKAHGSLPDCFATRDVWAWCTDPEERARIDAAKEEAYLSREVEYYLARCEMRQAEKDREHDLMLDLTNRHRLEPLLGVSFVCPAYLRAEASADVFCQHLTGYAVRVWERYGEHRLGLPRYDAVNSRRPKHLVLAREVHLLPKKKTAQPAALYVYGYNEQNPGQWLDAHDLYDLGKLRKGIDYVPIYPTADYPEGHYSATALARQFKLKPAVIAKLRPAWLKSTKYLDYLLYQYPPKPHRRPKNEPVLTA